MTEKLSKKIDREISLINRAKRQINVLNNRINSSELKVQDLNKVLEMFPDAQFSSYPISNQIIDASIVPDKRYISRAAVDSAISYSEYKNVIIDDKKIRIYKTVQKSICNYNRVFNRQAYNYRQPASVDVTTIRIFKDDVWNDPECKAKIKRIYKKMMSKIQSKNDVVFEGLEHAPDYIKMLSNFK